MIDLTGKTLNLDLGLFAIRTQMDIARHAVDVVYIVRGALANLQSSS